MIITIQKKLKEILKSLENKPVFIVGCSECATICHTGGEEEVLAMKDTLESNNLEVTGWVILEPACHLQNDKRILRTHKDELNKATKLLVLACGNGVQTIAEAVEDRDIIPGTDTLFLGEIQRATEFEKRCTMCGDCMVDLFEGLCPITRCPKHMLNGPCGGAVNDKCEINTHTDCVWILIYKRLKEKGRLHHLETIQEPKDWSKTTLTKITLSKTMKNPHQPKR